MISIIFTFFICFRSLQCTESHIIEPIVSEGPILYKTNINTFSPLSSHLTYLNGTKYIQFVVDFRNKETFKKYQRSFSRNNTNPNTKATLQLKSYSKESPTDNLCTQVMMDLPIFFCRYTNFSIVKKDTQEYKLVVSISSYTSETQVKNICECFKNENAVWQFVLMFYDNKNQSASVRTSIFKLNKSKEFL